MGEAKRREEFLMEREKRLSETPVIASIKIDFYQNGDFNVQSTNPDPILLYGMLERAKDVVRAMEKPAIIKQVPAGVIPDQVLKGGNGHH